MVVTFCCLASRGAEGSSAAPVRAHSPLERDQDSEAGVTREQETVNNKARQKAAVRHSKTKKHSMQRI